MVIELESGKILDVPIANIRGVIPYLAHCWHLDDAPSMVPLRLPCSERASADLLDNSIHPRILGFLSPKRANF